MAGFALRAVGLALAGVAVATVPTHPGKAVSTGQMTVQWTPRAPLPIARAEVGVAALGGRVYVVGGTEQKEGQRPVWQSRLTTAYDPKLDRWFDVAPLPTGMTHIGVTALNGRLYAIGGFTTAVHIGPKDLAYVYDPRLDRWSSLPGLSRPRGSVSVVAVDGRIHAFGGRISTEVEQVPVPPGVPPLFQGFGIVSTHQVFDPRTGRWTDAAAVPEPARDHAGAVVLAGKVHLFGGRTRDVGDTLARHDVYDPRTDTWSSAAPLPNPRSSGAFEVLDGKIVYAGGECRPGGRPGSPNTYDDVAVYDPATDRWTEVAPLPSARHAFGAAAVDHTAYFIGGAATCGGGATRDVYALRFR